MVEANYLKFTTSEEKSTLQKKLLDTGDRPLGEASTNDHVWGMGCTANMARFKGHFPGKNLLGMALQEVRSMLRQEIDEAESVRFAKKQVLGG